MREKCNPANRTQNAVCCHSVWLIAPPESALRENIHTEMYVRRVEIPSVMKAFVIHLKLCKI